MAELDNGNLLTMDNSGFVRVWQIDAADLFQSASTWKKLVGTLDSRTLAILYKDEQGRFVNAEGQLVGPDGQVIVPGGDLDAGDLPPGMDGSSGDSDGGGGGGGGGSSGGGGGGGDGEGDGSGDGDGNGSGSGSGERSGAPKDGRKPNFDDVSKLDIVSDDFSTLSTMKLRSDTDRFFSSSFFFFTKYSARAPLLQNWSPMPRSRCTT